MATQQIGLVDTTGQLDTDFVQAAAAAFNQQVIRDLPQFWDVQATVIYLPDPGYIPSEVWPVKLVGEGELAADQAGIHFDDQLQPYAKVKATVDSHRWTIDASHEILEMLIDPHGNKLLQGQSIGIADGTIQDRPGQSKFLVEACDPCQHHNYAYPIGSIAVSDFITPFYYDAVLKPDTRYSFNRKITAPRKVLPGGYVTYFDLETSQWHQILWIDPDQPPTIGNLDPADLGRSLRAWVDTKVARYASEKKLRRNTNQLLLDLCKSNWEKERLIARERAKHLK